MKKDKKSPAAIKKLLKQYIDAPNIAELLDGTELLEIGRECKKGFDLDDASRQDWVKLNEKVLKLAKLTVEKKNEPWEGAANIKYPLITTAIIQYAARTYPEIVKDGKCMHIWIPGPDKDGSKADTSQRLADWNNYKLLNDGGNWEDSIDRLLHVYATIGIAWKKTYRDNIKQVNESILCMHDEICINDNVESLDKACRVTHTLNYTKNMIIESMRAGLFLDMDMDKLDCMFKTDEDTIKLHEQHCYWDLDYDGYEEPYIITYSEAEQWVFRIKARYEEDGFTFNKKNEIVRIEPIQYFTDYHCLPRLDGKYHSYGIGTISYHPNCVINTLLNQTVNAGSLANTHCGYIGSGLEIKGGNKPFKLGEFKIAKAVNGSVLKDQIYQLEFKEPSQVIFSTLQMMITGGEKLCTVTDTATGNQDVSNAKSGAVQQMDANSLKVFSGMQKRLNRSLNSEFEKIFRLNKIYTSDEEYQEFCEDTTVTVAKDFNTKKLKLRPVADPNLASETQRLQKAQALSGFMQLPGINQQEIVSRMLQALQEPDYKRILEPMPPKTPPPELLKIQMDSQHHQAQQHLQMMAQELQQQQFNLEIEKVKAQIELTRAQAVGALAQADAVTKGIPLEALELQLKHLDTNNALVQTISNHELRQQEIDNDAANNSGGVGSPPSNSSSTQGT